MKPLDKACIGPLKTLYCQETEKQLRSNPGRVVTVQENGEQFGKAHKRAATGEIAANGFRATSLFPCDKTIFRPHDCPLTSEDKDAAPVNHPALMKTSDQPSISSAHFSPFTSAETLRASDISDVPSRNLQLNTRGGTAKKITSSPYKTVVGATQKKEITQATEIQKLSARVECSSWSFKKTEEKGLPGSKSV